MDEKEAKKILGDTVQDDNSLLDEYFEVGDLQAVAQWMIDHKEKGEKDGKRTCT